MAENLQKNYLQTERVGRAIDKPSDYAGIHTVLQTLLRIDGKAPAWWSPARDEYLREETYRNPFLDSIVSTVTMKIMNLPVRIQSRDSGVEKYNKLAYTYSDILLKALYRNQTLEKFVRSLLVQDNGAFLYITGNETADKPLISTPTGLLHLDSTLCTRTGDPDYPIVFRDYSGKYYKIHESRVIMCSQSPSVDAEMFGVGYSFVSRAMVLAQHFNDIFQYEAEVMGSRSSAEIIWGTGVRSDDIKRAFEIADIDSDNAGLTSYGKRVYIGMRESAGKLGKLQLKNLPENFSKRDDIEITLTLIALASGGSPNWFYDSVRTGSTKASASESTKMGESKLELWYINMITSELDYKFLPPSLVSMAGDVETDNNGVRARIKLNLAQTRLQNITSGVTDIRTERELQLQRGEINRSQFETLELKDGRIANGLPLYTLYQTDEKSLQELINFVENPLDFTENIKDPDILDKIDEYWENAQSIALNARTMNLQNNGLKAMYLLEWTRGEYEKALNVSPKYEFNEGIDPVTGEPIVAEEPQNVEEQSENEPELENVSDNVKSGLNDDEVVDTNVLTKMFTTRHLRKSKSALRSVARKFWNSEIDSDTFNKEFSNALDDTFDNDSIGHLDSYNYTNEIAQHIEKNLRKNNGLLPQIYKEVDKWILNYAGLTNNVV